MLVRQTRINPTDSKLNRGGPTDATPRQRRPPDGTLNSRPHMWYTKQWATPKMVYLTGEDPTYGTLNTRDPTDCKPIEETPQTIKETREACR